MSNLFLNATLLSAAVLFVTGCESYEVEEQFGEAVRHVVQAQKANPETSANPDPDPIDGTDSARVRAVLESYREAITEPEERSDEVTITFGGTNG